MFEKMMLVQTLYICVLLNCFQREASSLAVLTLGSPLKWAKSLSKLNYVREHGVKQFIHRFNQVKSADKFKVVWGDEIEYSMISLDHKTKVPRINLCATKVIEKLNENENQFSKEVGCMWMPEYGSWMIEGTPRKPYEGIENDLLRVEENMRLRRSRLKLILNDFDKLKVKGKGYNQHSKDHGFEETVAPTLSSFFMLGVGKKFFKKRDDLNDELKTLDFEDKNEQDSAFVNKITQSDTIPDVCINSHPRFGTLTENIRSRRGSKVSIKVPIFRDTATPEYLENCPKHGNHDSKSDESKYLELDAMAYGMGSCCTQVTMQACDEKQSRFLFDQLTVLSPLFLALTASTPICHGRLLDTDSRWSIIAQSVDDRTFEERNGNFDKDILSKKSSDKDSVSSLNSDTNCLAGNGVKPLFKSRFDSVSGYLSKEERFSDMIEQYNDIPRAQNHEAFKVLRMGGIDPLLSAHISHMFTRDPLVIFEGKVQEVNDKISMDHFNNIQSTNWQTVRWKLPEPEPKPEPEPEPEPQFSESKSNMSSDPTVSASSFSTSSFGRVGWRNEFRAMELQLTDFENAAFTVFIVLLSRVVVEEDLCLYIPISKVDENMKRAEMRDALNTQKFWFRRNVLSPPQEEKVMHDDCAELSLKEIMLGHKVNEVTGLQQKQNESIQKSVCENGENMSETNDSVVVGLIPLLHRYLDKCDALSNKVDNFNKDDGKVREKIDSYLTFIEKKLLGEVPTTATWLRNQVLKHPLYKNDSVVSDEIAYDVIKLCDMVGCGSIEVPELLGKICSK